MTDTRLIIDCATGAAVEAQLTPEEQQQRQQDAAAAAAQALAALRLERDNRLAASDWTQLPDVPLTADERQAWAVYRQQLRDFPDQPGVDPLNPDWPTPPEGGA